MWLSSCALDCITKIVSSTYGLEEITRKEITNKVQVVENKRQLETRGHREQFTLLKMLYWLGLLFVKEGSFVSR